MYKSTLPQEFFDYAGVFGLSPDDVDFVLTLSTYNLSEDEVYGYLVDYGFDEGEILFILEYL